MFVPWIASGWNDGFPTACLWTRSQRTRGAAPHPSATGSTTSGCGRRNEPSHDAVVSKRTNFVRSSNKGCRFDRWPLPVVSAPQQFAAGFADTTFEPAPLATRDGMGRSRTRFCASAQPMAGRHSVEWVAWVAIAAPVAAPPASAYDAVASGSCSSPRQAVHARSAATTGIRARCSSTTSSRARNGFTSRRAGSRVPWLGFEKRPESACYSAPTATRRWKLA